MRIGMLITLLVIYLVIMSVIEFKKSSKFDFLQQKVNQGIKYAKDLSVVTEKNLTTDFDPPRKRPLSMVDKEAKIVNMLPELFGPFEPNDWEKFWAVFYNPIKEKQGDFWVKRYRTQEEIESYLKEKYPNPFTYFQKNHWDYFWGIIFGRE